MRLKGTIYPEIETLPENAMAVSQFAAQNNMSIGHVYTKFKRATAGTTEVTYTIRCFKGTNYVIPN